jgi:predicted dehydrogenase
MNTITLSRILIVGKGSMGLRHLQLSRQLYPGAEIKILVHQKQNEDMNLSNEYLETMEHVQKFAPQIAIIANPATFHLETAQKLAELGVHLLIEKPISTSTVGVVELIKTCKENNAVLMTGYNLRFSSSLTNFRELIKKNTVGKILSIRCEVGQYLPDWRPNKDYRMTVSAINRLGGGVLLELSHEIDYLQWIFGDINWVRATLSKQSLLEIDVEDSAHLILGFEPNSNGSQLIANLNLDFIRHDRTRSCTVIGDKGTLRWDGLTGTVDIFMQHSEKWEVLYSCKPDTKDTLFAEWENFLESINQECYPRITGIDGLRVLEIIEAARKSSATGSQVEVIKNPLYFENTL